MSHTPYVEDIVEADCIYGECSHDGVEIGAECPTRAVVACVPCTEAAPENNEGFRPVVPWPCLYATIHGTRTDELIAKLLADHAARVSS